MRTAGKRLWGARREGTFLLGAGAHLAGTTALHRYLAASPQVDAGAHREWHVLDSAGLASERWVRDLLLDRARHSIEQARGSDDVSGSSLLRAAMVLDPEVYLDHFAGLLARPGIRLTMDLTPDHALLSQDQLALVRDGFEERGVRTVATFVMRDPLDRLVTHVRLQQKQRPAMFPGPLEEWVERLYTDPTYELRTRYERTVETLDGVFGPGRSWYGFHERLGTTDSLTAVCTLCRIDVHEDERPAARQPTATAGLPPDLARKVVDHYKNTYEYVADRFGVDDLAAIWPSARHAF